MLPASHEKSANSHDSERATRARSGRRYTQGDSRTLSADFTRSALTVIVVSDGGVTLQVCGRRCRKGCARRPFENPEARYLEGAPARRKAALLARSVDDLGDLLLGQVPLVNSDDDS